MTLEILTTDVLTPVHHGFFTRRGGASSGIFHSLNCGGGSSDHSQAVDLNRDRVAKAMQVEPAHLITMHQVHSPEVITLTAIPAPGSARAKADAMVTATPGLALGVLTADCQPVLLSDAVAGVVGAAHAGWKGAMAGVLEATIEAMEGLGARRKNISAGIGPTISQTAYEVGPEFFDEFTDHDPENSRFFAGGDGDRVHFDLPGYGLKRLRAAGVGHAEWTRHCTYTDEERFYSYRRATHRREVDYGRLISVIRL